MNKVTYGVKETYREQHMKDIHLMFYQNSSLPSVQKPEIDFIPKTCNCFLFCSIKSEHL